MKIEPDNALDYNARGLAYKSLGEIESAMSDFRKAVELGFTEAYGGIGAMYGMKQDYERAFSNFDKAINLHPENSDALSGRAFIYAARNDHNNAEKDINRAIELNPENPELSFTKGAINAMSGKKNEAIKDFQKFLSIALPMHQRGADYARNYLNENAFESLLGNML